MLRSFPVCLGEFAGTRSAWDFMGSNILLGEDPRCRGLGFAVLRIAIGILDVNRSGRARDEGQKLLG